MNVLYGLFFLSNAFYQKYLYNAAMPISDEIWQCIPINNDNIELKHIFYFIYLFFFKQWIKMNWSAIEGL
jgi:hypothetical protein